MLASTLDSICGGYCERHPLFENPTLSRVFSGNGFCQSFPRDGALPREIQRSEQQVVKLQSPDEQIVIEQQPDQQVVKLSKSLFFPLSSARVGLFKRTAALFDKGCLLLQEPCGGSLQQGKDGRVRRARLRAVTKRNFTPSAGGSF